MAYDGTQDPGPPPVLSDPVSGLVTGSRYEPEPLKVRVVEPPMPDLSAVREAMAGMFDEDSELNLGLAKQSGSPAANAAPAEETQDPPAAAPTADPTPTPPIGIPAQQSTRPAAARRAPRQPATARVITPGTIEMPRRLPGRIRRSQSVRRPASAVGRKSSAPSVAAIAVLLLVIGVIAIVLISSLIDTIASIFG